MLGQPIRERDRTEKVGRTRICRIERKALTGAEQWMSDQRRGWEVRLDRLGDILNELPTSKEKSSPNHPLPMTPSSSSEVTRLRSHRSFVRGPIPHLTSIHRDERARDRFAIESLSLSASLRHFR